MTTRIEIKNEGPGDVEILTLEVNVSSGIPLKVEKVEVLKPNEKAVEKYTYDTRQFLVREK